MTQDTNAGQFARSELDAIYAERNLIALAFARVAATLGYTVGQIVDPAEPDWPVLMVDTPAGQVSWHLTRAEMPSTMPAYPGEWDGHTTPEKNDRLREIVTDLWLGA